MRGRSAGEGGGPVAWPGLTAGLVLALRPCDVDCGADEEDDVKCKPAITCQASHHAQSLWWPDGEAFGAAVVVGLHGAFPRFHTSSHSISSSPSVANEYTAIIRIDCQQCGIMSNEVCKALEDISSIFGRCACHG